MLVFFAEGSNGFSHIVFGPRYLEIIFQRSAGWHAVAGDVHTFINTLGHRLVLHQRVEFILGRCVAIDVLEATNGSAKRFYTENSIKSS